MGESPQKQLQILGTRRKENLLQLAASHCRKHNSSVFFGTTGLVLKRRQRFGFDSLCQVFGKALLDNRHAGPQCVQVPDATAEVADRV